MNKIIDYKFAARHKPTGKWVKLWYGLLNEYSAINILDEDLTYSSWSDGRGRVETSEFEILKIEVTYTIPESGNN